MGIEQVAAIFSVQRRKRLPSSIKPYKARMTFATFDAPETSEQDLQQCGTN